jgi:GNAT superfamily N-acetyltransferase
MPATDTAPVEPATAAKIPQIAIRALRPGDDATAFRTLNEEWITRHFVLEPKDIETLNHPGTAILDKGGQILIVYADDAPVGCVALIPMRDRVYELSKMAVTPAMRGRGLGRKLIEHTIAQARVMGAKSLFLGSNSKLPAAVTLYESVGFRHVDPATLPEMHYARADVFMELPL